jgi:hypothetical protein
MGIDPSFHGSGSSGGSARHTPARCAQYKTMLMDREIFFYLIIVSLILIAFLFLLFKPL